MTIAEFIIGRKEVCPTRTALIKQKEELSKKIGRLKMELEDGNHKMIPVGEEWNEVLPQVFLKEMIPHIPHEKTTVAILNGKKGSESPLHRHTQKELVHLIAGKVEEKATGAIYDKVGSFFELNEGELHGLKFLEDSLLILQWIPKI